MNRNPDTLHMFTSERDRSKAQRMFVVPRPLQTPIRLRAKTILTGPIVPLGPGAVSLIIILSVNKSIKSEEYQEIIVSSVM